MDLKVSNNYKPAFTAQLRGTAIRSALRNAKDGFQIGEVSEILNRASEMGDSATIINCGADGTVTVSNDKFGISTYKYKLKKYEQSDNPALDLLRNFSSENGILKTEYNLFNYIFEHSKSMVSKKSKYKFYSSLPLSGTTKGMLDSAAKKQGIIPATPMPGIEAKTPEEELEKFKSIILKNFEHYV